MKISKGQVEEGIVVGNNFDKYGSVNPLVRLIMRGFHDALDELSKKVVPTSIHEVGCGEGYWALRWVAEGIDVRGSDFSVKVIEIAKLNAKAQGVNPQIFSSKSIYDLRTERDAADLVVCCEVLEHLEDPRAALKVLREISKPYVILSVPREPIWCGLNMARGKYVRGLGNTPGHIQHWNSRAFVRLVSEYFDVLEVRKPLPWTMLLARTRK
ncbi:class I SAM-dependent methyltransferase [Ottowia thiooxydans]|uniref:class I SAM-dependent methyltransferase n=1 Tax=Ottowia thiooxydans TaxID=219182 RepID=UPI00055C4D7F|nr:class I SAM-dependent methyltransferase [Ottowia thiooxydans]